MTKPVVEITIDKGGRPIGVTVSEEVTVIFRYEGAHTIYIPNIRIDSSLLSNYLKSSKIYGPLTD